VKRSVPTSALAAALIMLAGCSDANDSSASADEPVPSVTTEVTAGRTAERITGVEPSIEGDFGVLPTVKIPGLEAKDGSSGSTIEGDGTVVAADDRLVAHLGVYDLENGAILGETWVEEIPLLFELNAEQASPALLDGLPGISVGSRVWMITTADRAKSPGAAPGGDGSQRVLMVVDVVEAVHVNDTVTGNVRETPPGYPTVTGEPGMKPIVSKATVAPPTAPFRVPIIANEGPAVISGAQTIIHYVMTDWETGEEVDSSWETHKGPLFYLVGTGNLPERVWQQLIGVTDRSRVMVIIPPAGDGSDLAPGLDPTRTYVVTIDVLDLRGNAGTDQTEFDAK